MTPDEWESVIEVARDAGLSVYADVFGEESLELADGLAVDGYKVHNADVSNTPLLEAIANRDGEVLLSAGGSTWIELAEALETFDEERVTLMYGFQNYPTAPEDANLSRLEKLSEEFECRVGYASHVAGDHSLATDIPRLAVVAGAEAIEVHVTLDRSERGTDYESALEPQEFAEMASSIRSVEELLGGQTFDLTDSEFEYRKNHKKWLVATERIEVGEELTAENVGYRRLPDPDGSSPLDIGSVLGKTASEPIEKTSVIKWQQLDMNVVATLACRAESSRMYGKPLQRVGDRPILAHLVERLKRAAVIDEIVLAIADTPSRSAFVEFANKYNLEYIVGSEPDVLDRLIQAGNAANADHIARVTTENPFVYWENLDELVREHAEHNADLTTTRDLPLGTTVEIVALDALEKAHKHGGDKYRSELCTLFLVEHPQCFTIQAFDPPEHLNRPEIRLTIDNPEDLVLARRLYDLTDATVTDPPLGKLVKTIDENPDIMSLNDQFPDGTDNDIQCVRPFMYGNRDTES